MTDDYTEEYAPAPRIMDIVNPQPTAAVIIHRFTNHPPVNADVGHLFDQVTEMFTAMGQFIIATVPQGREQSLALTNLEQASFWSKAGLARNQPDT